jgi:hypothetical protein
MFESLLARADAAGLTAHVRARLHLFHGSHLCRHGSFDESETALKKAASLVRDYRMGTRNTTPDDILVEFIALYVAWQKPDKVREYDAIRQRTLANLPFDPS